MVDIKVMHEIYVRELNTKKDVFKNKLSEYISKHEKLVELLCKHKDTINLYLNVTLNNILSNTSKNFIDSITYPIMKVYDNGKEINFDVIKLYIKEYTWVNNIIVTYKREIEKIDNQIIPFKDYSDIINSFNNQMIDKIIHENYKFEPRATFGSIYVIRNENERKRVNWGASDKKKKQLIEEGKIPYKKEDALTIPNYQGVNWLVYLPSIDYYLQWSKTYTGIKLNPWLKDYGYNPARGVNSIVSKLTEVKKDTELAARLYTRTIKKFKKHD